MTREALFAAVKPYAPGQRFTPAMVSMVDALADRFGLARTEAPLRRINAAGLALIKVSEGLRLDAYRCPADVPTIGYGSTGAHVRMGMRITEAEAEVLLLDDLERFEAGITKLAAKTTDGQFAACVSLAFNVGLGAFGGSTLLKLHNAGDYAGAAVQFGRWDRAGGRSLPGLTKRRAAERALYEGKTV